MKRYRRTLRVLAAIMMGLLAALPVARPQPAAAIDEDVVDRVYPAVVQLGPIVELTDDQGEKTIRFLGWGSGTIVDPDGYILTNHHVTDVSDLIAQLEDRPDVRVIEGRMAVFITADTDNPPIPTYIADVVVDAPELDLAVVKVTEDLSGHDLSGESLGLPFVPLGDSNKLKLGQKVHIFGYPAIGGETITFTSGDISGFSFEASVEGRAWIKTNATISGGNSGGTAVDDAGNLIGVPTQGGSGNNPDIVDCRRLVDTNGDGVINEDDSCVPFGGFINALRPVNLAMPLITQARNGIGPQPSPTRQPRTPTPEGTEVPATPRTPVGTSTPGTPGRTTPTATAQAGTGDARVSRMIIANGIDDNGYPLSVVTSLPSGSPNVICYFDYSGFETGGLLQLRASIDGEEVVDAWPLYEWDAESYGSAGLWWFGWLEAEGLPDGTYEFQVEYNGETLGTTSIEMGGPEESKPMFSNVNFSGGGETGTVLTAGLDELTANFTASNMGSEDWQAIWYQRDEAGEWNEIFSSPEEAWAEGADGEFSTVLEADAPLDEGTYRVDLNIDGELSGTADVWLVGGSNNNTGLFGPVVFGDALDEDGNAANPNTEFEDPTFELYAVWEYEGMEDGLDWNLQWLLDGEVIIDQDEQWAGGESGTWSTYLYMQDGAPLPVGEYEIQLSIQGEPVQTAIATIGDIANRPTPTPTPSLEDSVVIKGTITDATTGQPIENAIFVVLAEGVTWDTFEDSADQVLDLAFTDGDGQFTLFTPLPRGKSFSMGAFAEGYQPSVQDGVPITDDLDATVDISIALEQE
jgi:S1-C subfamily serine protease